MSGRLVGLGCGGDLGMSQARGTPKSVGEWGEAKRLSSRERL